MTAYYNEIDPYAAQWLRNLISAGHIAPGDVDERSIADVRGDEIAGYTQCHFFAGLGGWSRALRLAEWRDDRHVWTGSCPCQPFSSAGKRAGGSDERHLWPSWFSLIRERKPAIIFGEQVARAVGKRWLDAVAHDLEAEAYAFGSAILPACAIGAPHRRDRIWFLADSRHQAGSAEPRQQQGKRAAILDGSRPVHVANTNGGGWPARDRHLSTTGYGRSAASGRDDGHANGAGLALGQGERGNACEKQSPLIGADWWTTEPDVGRVANGVPDRVDKLRALGNAIVPQVAAEFIKLTEG